MLAGRIVVGKHVWRAVERHRQDLKSGRKRGLHFDRGDAEFAIECFTFFRHSKGRWAGQSFLLSPWQQFIVWCLFGWKRRDGNRRFRRAYIEIARKNGKSTFLAGILIILFALDGEAGAEVYSAATKKEQARIVFNEAKRMVKASADLREFIHSYRNNLDVVSTNSKFEPLSSDANSLDGLNIHGAGVDELHAHRTREVWDVLDTATGSRSQPLIAIITTAGFDQEGICFEIRGYCIEVLDPALDVADDSWFVFIAAVDDEDDWQDEANWPKANPNLGISVSLEDLRDGARRARRNSSALNNFLCKHLNRWTQQAQRWIAIERWDECRLVGEHDVPVPADVYDRELTGRECFGGLDLSEKLDLSAFCLIFPPTGQEGYRALWRFWLPKDTADDRAAAGDPKYIEWEKEGLIELIAGNVIDQDLIRNEIKLLGSRFQIRQIGYDPWEARDIAQKLKDQDGFEMVEVPGNFSHMNEAAKDFEVKIVGHRLLHDGNKVMRWMMGNAAIICDKNGAIRPIKPKDRRKKVDGVVAAVIANSRLIVTPAGGSFYDNNDLMVVDPNQPRR